MDRKKHQTATAVLARSAVDRQFRNHLLTDPRAALKAAFALVLPSDYNVRFIERDAHLDALIVLPDFQGEPEAGDIDDDALEPVNGGRAAGPGNATSWAADDGSWLPSS
jgi:hypothetical protein